jgi:hypothetical protein
MQAEREARGLVRREAWSSGCFGVTWHARDGKWQGQFRVDKRKAFVCLLDSEREAAAAVVARQRELGLDPDRRQASEFCGVGWKKDCQKWQAQIKIAGKQRHLGLFGAGHSGEVDAALAFDTAVRAFALVGRAGNNAREHSNFEVPGPGARGLSRDQTGDVEARLERHLRAALLGAGRDNSFRMKGKNQSFRRRAAQAPKVQNGEARFRP